jgi:hypothetical protein
MSLFRGPASVQPDENLFSRYLSHFELLQAAKLFAVNSDGKDSDEQSWSYILQYAVFSRRMIHVDNYDRYVRYDSNAFLILLQYIIMDKLCLDLDVPIRGRIGQRKSQLSFNRPTFRVTPPAISPIKPARGLLCIA